MRNFEDLKIAVAGTGYVGLSMATLLSQNKIGFVSPARRYEAPTVVRPPQM